MVDDLLAKCKFFVLNQQGFIPGPNESEEKFLERVDASKHLSLAPPSPFQGMDQVPDAHWDWARHHLQDLYGFQPQSLKAYYSNRKLAPWQGAASWILPGPLCVIQLRKGFRKGRYLGLYSRDEILAHEAVHAARCAFQESENEEFFAYGTSGMKWRRALGPILRRPWEALCFCVSLCFGAVTGNFWIASILLVIAFIRLGRQHMRLQRAARMISKVIPDERSIRSLFLRLTDQEIRQLAKGKLLQDDGSLRFRIIKQYGDVWQKE